MGAADRLSNNPIGQCPETRYICSAQITLPHAHCWTSLHASPPILSITSSSPMLGQRHTRENREERPEALSIMGGYRHVRSGNKISVELYYSTCINATYAGRIDTMADFIPGLWSRYM